MCGIGVLTSGISGCVCLISVHSVSFLQDFPVDPLFASSSAASFPSSLLCPFMCSSLISLCCLTCLSSVLAFAAKYLLVSALYSPVAIFAAYFES